MKRMDDIKDELYEMAQHSKENNNKKTLLFRNVSPNQDPEYAHDKDSGFDLRAWVMDDEENIIKGAVNTILLEPLERRLIHTGIYVKLPEGTELQVRSKSGQTLKKGLVVANSPGTVDNGYSGEVCVIAFNISNKPITIVNNEKIAQAVLCPVYIGGMVNLQKVNEISTNTDRGTDGFGSTGI